MDPVRTSPVTEVFWSYTRAFASLDPNAVATHFNEPALMIVPDGVHALPNAAAVEQMYARVMDDLRGRDYARTEFSAIEERHLGEGLAMLTGKGNWVDKAGRKFMPFGLTYTLRRADGKWRIAVAVIHSADAK